MNHVTVSSSPVKITLRYGQKGERGIGISSVALDDQAHLIITYDDGKTQDAGAALGDVTSIKDSIDSTYRKIQASEANVTKLETSTKTNAEKAQQALQDTQSASTSGVNTINTLVSEKITYMTSTFNSLLTQTEANIDQWERDAEDKIHKVRTYSLEQIKTAHDDAMVDIERSVNKAEAWAVSETTPDREPDFESPTGLTQSSRTWALYSKKKVQEAIDILNGIEGNETDVSNMKNEVAELLRRAQASEQNTQDYMNAASASQKAAKKSEKTAEAYMENTKADMENTKADAERVNAAVTTATNTANDLASKLNNLQNPPKELTGETKGALHVLYLDNTEKDITLAEMGADTSAQVSAKVAESLSTAKLYTDQKVASLIDGAPEALDTLKELADALGNDANVAANVTKKIGELSTSLTNEINTRKTSDDEINANIRTQVDKLQASDTVLSDRLNTEVQSRETGDIEGYTRATSYTDTKVVQSNSTIIKYVDDITNNVATNDDIDSLFAEREI